MLTIGLTGGIGSGKSEVAGILRDLGATVVNADLVGHRVYRRGQPAFERIVEAFGPEVVGQDGEIDRKHLGGVVFNDPEGLRRLTDIVWPEIREALGVRIAEERRDGRASVLVVEAAVLMEAGWDNLFDEVWAVTAPEATVLDRLREHRNLSEEQARARMRAQMTDTERERRADVTVRNDGDRANLAATVGRLWAECIKGRHDG